MLSKLMAALARVIFLLGLAAGGLLNSGIQKKNDVKWEDQHSLKEIARRSKELGKARITLPGPHANLPGVNMSLDEALRDHSVVVAEVVARKSYVFDSYGIRTWYRFRITDALSQRIAKYCPTCPEVGEAPQDLLPINSDEFLLATGGGTVNIDGVEVTVDSQSLPTFESGKRYLLFVSLTPSGVARLGAGPAGIFRVADNEKLEAVDKRNYPIKAEVSRRFAGKLSEFRSHVKH